MSGKDTSRKLGKVAFTLNTPLHQNGSLSFLVNCLTPHGEIFLECTVHSPALKCSRWRISGYLLPGSVGASPQQGSTTSRPRYWAAQQEVSLKVMHLTHPKTIPTIPICGKLSSRKPATGASADCLRETEGPVCRPRPQRTSPGCQCLFSSQGSTRPSFWPPECSCRWTPVG